MRILLSLSHLLIQAVAPIDGFKLDADGVLDGDYRTRL
jgi:hypothetical protein